MLFPGFDVILFGIFFVMTEGAVQEIGAWEERKIITLLFIDVLQVVRVITSASYGWSATTSQAVRNCDIVYIFTRLVSSVIPRYSLFILAFILVSVTLLDTIYVAKLFAAGEVKKMWPVKLLRKVVSIVVTILFSSIIKWLLIPTDCLVSLERPTFSEEINPGGAECDPFGMPSVLATVPMVLTALSYILFALITSYLSFECNPLSRQPRASSTGRVEVLFAMVKVSGTVLIYFADFITSVAVTAIIFLGSVYVFRAHLARLPWQDQRINMLRGGVLGCVTHLAGSSCVVASLEAANFMQDTSTKQSVQYTLIGLLPVAFATGIWLVNRRKEGIVTKINRLRGDWEAQTATQQAIDTAAGGTGDDQHDHQSLAGAQAIVQKKTMYTSFFDPTLDSKRAFSSSIEALTACRVLLLQRVESDLPFLRHVMQRGLEEHPDCPCLKILQLTIERFVLKNKLQAAETEKNLKRGLNSLPIDFQYVFYVVERKATQANAVETIGLGNVTSMNLMEWGAGIDRAKKAHMAALHHIRDFWRQLRKTSRDRMDKSEMAELIQKLDDYEESTEAAKTEYETLLVNYSSSVELLQAYAHFQDSILNDSRTADMIRQQAITLDDSPEAAEGMDDNMQHILEQACAQSASTSAADNVRVKTSKWLDVFSDKILGKEQSLMVALEFKVRAFVLLLVAVSTVGFVLIDIGLLSEEAMFTNIELIDKTAVNRGYGMIALYDLRDMFLASRAGDRHKFEDARGSLFQVSEAMTAQQLINYEHARSADLKKFYNEKECHFVVPIHDKWMNRTMNFWEYGIEYSRLMSRAGSTTFEDMSSLNNKIGNISMQKASVQFLFENTHRNYIPTMEELLSKYENNVEALGKLASQSVDIVCSFNAILVVFMTFFVVKQLPSALKSLQSRHLSCSFGMSLPRNVCFRIYKYYDEIVLQMKMMEDEEMAAMQVVGEDADQGGAPHMDGDDEPEGSQGSHEGDAKEKPKGNRKEIVESEGLCDLTLANLERYTQENSKISTFDMLNHKQQSPKAEQPFSSSAPPFTSPSPGMWTAEDVGMEGNQEDALFDSSIDLAVDGKKQGEGGGNVTVKRVLSDQGSASKRSILKQVSPSPSQRGGGFQASTKSLTFSAVEDPSPKLQENKICSQLVVVDGGVTPEAAASGLASKYKKALGKPSSSDIQISFSARKGEGSGTDSDRDGSGRKFGRKEKDESKGGGSGDTGDRLYWEIEEERRDSKKKKSKAQSGNSELFARTFSDIPKPETLGKDGELAEISSTTIDMIHERLTKKQPWYTKTEVFVTVFAAVFALSVFSMLYPARLITLIVNMGPTTNQAGRRRFLTEAVVFYTRELVLNDKFARMDRAEAVADLEYYLHELEAANIAITRGGSKRITSGADARSHRHNELMYAPGCPWREDPTNCSSVIRPDAATRGLHYMYSTFVDATLAIIAKYEGLLDGEVAHKQDLFAYHLDSTKFDTTDWNATVQGLKVLEGDPNAAFIVEQFHGDLHQGWKYAVQIFYDETHELLEKAHFEFLTYFIVYLVGLVCLFYFVLFRRTVSGAVTEGDKARIWIHRVPMHLFTPEELLLVESYFGVKQATNANGM
mmetsp:Transcript_23995/g.60234  ORF Transcript_23995/g.60234 Transcript_23995/m.60234 type:complete len:1595 (-) Transcript_23995:82-4866(-)